MQSERASGRRRPRKTQDATTALAQRYSLQGPLRSSQRSSSQLSHMFFSFTLSRSLALHTRSRHLCLPHTHASHSIQRFLESAYFCLSVLIQLLTMVMAIFTLESFHRSHIDDWRCTSSRWLGTRCPCGGQEELAQRLTRTFQRFMLVGCGIDHMNQRSLLPLTCCSAG